MCSLWYLHGNGLNIFDRKESKNNRSYSLQMRVDVFTIETDKSFYNVNYLVVTKLIIHIYFIAIVFPEFQNCIINTNYKQMQLKSKTLQHTKINSYIYFCFKQQTIYFKLISRYLVFKYYLKPVMSNAMSVGMGMKSGHENNTHQKHI